MDNFWKGKKVVAYIALAHHTRFIIPVMEELERRGAVIKYIVGQAERSQEVTAIEKGLSYAHIFDYVSAADMEEIRENYSRMGKTFSGSLKRDFFLGILPVTVTDKTLLAAAQEYTGFKNMFREERPDLCFALHEINRWGKIFAFWAKKNNVPFVSLQEGLSYGLDFGLSGHAQYSTLNLVWGERIRRKLCSFEAPASKIMAVGNTHLAEEIARQKRENIREKKRKAYKIENNYVALLILSSRLPLPKLFTPVFKAVSGTSGLTLFVKFHPACKKEQIEAWTGSLTEKFPNHSFFIHGQESTYDLVSMADVVVLGQKSTTGLETLAFGKPLVKLDFAYEPKAPYSFVDQGVALKLTAEELAAALKERTDFSRRMDGEKIQSYLKWELADTETAIQTVCGIFKKAITANKGQVQPLSPRNKTADRRWTVVLQVPPSPEILLAQIEALAVNSQGGGTYETIFLLPEDLPPETEEILASLEGDLKWVRPEKGDEPLELLNQALCHATGETLIFLPPGLAPLSGWLDHLEKGIATHGRTRIFGARISDNQGKIVHSGVVVDRNNDPVSAYAHLDINFAPALKERPFQMIDHFMAVDRETFLALGGITPEAGDYMFLDFCLKSQAASGDDAPPVYLPDLQLIYIEVPLPKEDREQAVYFYSRWHGMLWESESRLIGHDKVSEDELGHARLSAAMKFFG